MIVKRKVDGEMLSPGKEEMEPLAQEESTVGKAVKSSKMCNKRNRGSVNERKKNTKTLVLST